MPPTWSSEVQNTSAERISLGKLQSNPQAKPLIGKSRHRQTSPEMMFLNFREPQVQAAANHLKARRQILLVRIRGSRAALHSWNRGAASSLTGRDSAYRTLFQLQVADLNA